MNIHIEKIEGFSVLVYTHKTHGSTLWKVYLLSDVPAERREQALEKQERIANKRNCIVKTVEINRPPCTVDVLIGRSNSV